MLTINQLAKRYKLSRSTLLYYDKIGLLSPSARSQANYRLYANYDIEKMDKIARYKDAGLSLDEIHLLVNAKTSKASEILERRLESLNKEMNQLRKQQQLIVSLLDEKSLLRTTKVMTKEQWVGILRASGMSDEDMHRWHKEFERDLPHVHEDFLLSLGCQPSEVEQIKAWSK